MLAFYNELDRWLNAKLLTVPVRDAPMLDPFVLRERTEALELRARVDQVDLRLEPGEACSVWLTPKTDPGTGKDYELPYNEVFLDPYTGERIGARKWGEVSLAKEDILSFLYWLHMTLALPEATGSLGGYRYPRHHGTRLDDRLFHRVLSDLAGGAEKTDASLPLTKGEI